MSRPVEDRIARAVFWGLLGSIYLGWHYAIDGYVSIIAVVLIWKLAGVILANSKDIESLVPQAGTSAQSQ